MISESPRRPRRSGVRGVWSVPGVPGKHISLGADPAIASGGEECLLRARAFDHLRAAVRQVDDKVDRGRDALSVRMDALDHKVDRVREELSAQTEAVRRELSARIDALDQKMSRQFLWVLGVQITVLLAVIGTLLADSSGQ